MKGGAGKAIVVSVLAAALVAGAIVMGMSAQREREKECDEWSDRYVAAVDAAIEDGSIQALATGEEPSGGAAEVIEIAEDKPDPCEPPQTDIPFPATG